MPLIAGFFFQNKYQQVWFAKALNIQFSYRAALTKVR